MEEEEEEECSMFYVVPLIVHRVHYDYYSATFRKIFWL